MPSSRAHRMREYVRMVQCVPSRTISAFSSGCIAGVILHASQVTWATAERGISSSKPCLQVVIVCDALHVVQQHVLCGATEGRRQARCHFVAGAKSRTSKKTTGLSQRMALFSSALAFAGVLHATSCTPGMAWK